MWKEREKRKVKPGSLSTISRALKNLHQKGFASYDVVDRKWRITPLGHWIMVDRLLPTKSSLALTRVMEPLLSTVRNHPEELTELLCSMFEYSFGRRGKLSEQEGMVLKQAERKLTSFIKGYPDAVEAIWGDGVERVVGGFSGIMAVVLLFRSSLFEDYRTQQYAPTAIPKIVEQCFKPLTMELGKFLSNSLADLDELDQRVNAEKRRRLSRKGTNQ